MSRFYSFFDLDGTILDTTALILESFRHAFWQGLGERVHDEAILMHFGRPLVEQFRLMRPDLPPERVDKLVAIYREHNEREHDRFTRVVPGAYEGLYALYRAGFALGIVTSKRENLTERGLVNAGMRPWFRWIVHADSTPRHKPHPEPVLHAMALAGAPAALSAYTGDSPYDMAAAKGAGVRAIGLVYNTFTADALKAHGADYVATNWQAVVDRLKMWAEHPVSRAYHG